MSPKRPNEDDREYCKLCKGGTEMGIKSAKSRANWAIGFSVGLLGICFGLSAIAWSARADVTNQKSTIEEIRADQKVIMAELNRITTFIELARDGKIVFAGKRKGDEQSTQPTHR